MHNQFDALDILLSHCEEASSSNVEVSPAASSTTSVYNGMKLPTTKSLFRNFNIIEKKTNTPISNYEVYMFGPIFDQNAEELYQLLEYAPEDSTIQFFIGSVGGSLQFGASLAGAMRHTKAHTITTAVGLAASVGSLLWMSGKEKTLYPCTAIMYHMSSHGQFDNSVLMKERAEYLIEYVNKAVIIPAVKEGILTPEEAEDIVLRRKTIYIDYKTMSDRLLAIQGDSK